MGILGKYFVNERKLNWTRTTSNLGTVIAITRSECGKQNPMVMVLSYTKSGFTLFSIVAKDSHNPTMLKLVLQALSTQWQVDIPELTSTVSQTKQNVVTKGVVRNRGKSRRMSITSAISCEHRGKELMQSFPSSLTGALVL